MAFSLTDLLGGSLGSAIGDIISKFKASPDKVLEMQEMVAQNQSAVEQKQLELESKLQDSLTAEIQAASANIQAEAKSDDKFTSRARPMFMYIIESILAFNYILVPLARVVFHTSVTPMELPSNLLALFGVSITGYTAFRSFEKFMGMPGDSQVQVGSIKIGNKQ